MNKLREIRLIKSNMTEKAEVVFVLLIFRIKAMGKGQPEYKGIVRAVRIMAGSTVALNYRPVLKPPFLPDPVFLMTAVTQIIDPVLQKIFSV